MKLQRTQEQSQLRRTSGEVSITRVDSLVYDTGKGEADIYPMIKGLAKKMFKGNVGSITFQDLIGAGLKGFSEALSKWRRNEGTKLTTFAYPRIKGEMLDLLARETTYENRHEVVDPSRFFMLQAPDHFEEQTSNHLLFLRIISYMEEELSDEHKLCLVRFYLEDVPERLIAEELDCTQGEVTKTRKEALALLQDRFSRYAPPGAGDWISD